MMKQYFYLDGDMRQHGPCSIDELRVAGITQATKVWSAGMPDWDDAGNIPELNVLFANHAIPVPGGYSDPGQRHQAAEPAKPDSWLAWSIIATILCCWPLGIPGIVYAAKVDSLWLDKKYDEAIRAARLARTWTIASIITGSVTIFGYLLLALFGIVSNIFTGMQ